MFIDMTFCVLSDIQYFIEKNIRIFFELKNSIDKTKYIQKNAFANVILINGYTGLTSEKLKEYNDWKPWINHLSKLNFNIFVPIFNDFQHEGVDEHTKSIQILIDEIHKINNKNIYIIAYSYGTLVANELLKSNNIKLALFLGSPIFGVNKCMYDIFKNKVKENKTAYDIINYKSQINSSVILIYGEYDYIVKKYQLETSNKCFIFKNCAHYTLITSPKVMFFCFIKILFDIRRDSF